MGVMSCGSHIIGGSSAIMPVVPEILRENLSKISKQPTFHYDLSDPIENPNNHFEESILIESLNRLFMASPAISQFLETVKIARSSNTLPGIVIRPTRMGYMITGASYSDENDKIRIALSSLREIVNRLIFEYGNAKRRKQLQEVTRKLHAGHFRCGLKYAEAKERIEHETWMECEQVFDQFCQEQGWPPKQRSSAFQRLLNESGEEFSRKNNFNISFPIYWKDSLRVSHVKIYAEVYNQCFRSIPRTCTCEECRK